MPRRRKSTATVPTPSVPQQSSGSSQGLTLSSLHLVEPLLTVLVNAGVTDFQGFGLTIRLGPRPVVERRVLVPIPASPSVTMPGPSTPLTPEGREAVLSRLEGQGVDESNPIFDAVRRSST